MMGTGFCFHETSTGSYMCFVERSCQSVLGNSIDSGLAVRICMGSSKLRVGEVLADLHQVLRAVGRNMFGLC